MARDWPAKDIGPLVELIADPRHRIAAGGTIRLSDEQARAILDLRLQRLTALGRDEIGDELKKLGEEIKDHLGVLASRVRIVDIIKKELAAIKAEFATPRLTEIVEMEGEVEDEDLIQREDVVVTVSHRGYIKRVPLSTYRAQRRGGKGRAGMATREEDVVTQIFVASTHTPLLFFSSRGMVYRMKVWRLPAGTPQSVGKALVNLLPLSEGEVITSILQLPEDQETWATLELMFATKSGNVRRNSLSDFKNITRKGMIAMKLAEGDRIVRVAVCQPGEPLSENAASADQDIQDEVTDEASEPDGERAEKKRKVRALENVLLTTAMGRCVRFKVDDVRLFKGRGSDGVRGIRLETGDEVISMAILRHVEATPGEREIYLKQALAMRRAQGAEGPEMPETEVEADAESAETNANLSASRYAELAAHEQFVLTVSERGFGKRSSSYDYRITGRGGKGLVAMVVNERNGRLIASFPVEESDQIMLVTDGGQLIRCPVDDVRITGRSVQGVRIFKTEESEKVVSVERVPDDGNGADAQGEGGQTPEPQ
jgi:DNA gyrase subunit A